MFYVYVYSLHVYLWLFVMVIRCGVLGVGDERQNR